MKFLEYKRIEEPPKVDKFEMYSLYKALYKTHFSITKKRNIMTSILGREKWSWRVVGITKEAIKKIIEYNYKVSVKKELQRDHYFQGRNQTYSEIFDKFHTFDDWWKKVWENDRTILMTKLEHSLKKNVQIYDLDWTLGLFQCAKQVGFEYTQGREGYYINKNYSSKIK